MKFIVIEDVRVTVSEFDCKPNKITLLRLYDEDRTLLHGCVFRIVSQRLTSGQAQLGKAFAARIGICGGGMLM
jgi:hypothetical protein